ncbi:hypothetical protein [Leptolyngbya sp. PCC 6406]|uniref:hypothetical protein n=1 Tax=Leptolyngbya sp. PCC 6406 TaxID=1173264 RepID=UPI0002AC67D1|nr:hypothetical protein [Leptolyngbya sp. PCC 6406]
MHPVHLSQSSTAQSAPLLTGRALLAGSLVTALILLLLDFQNLRSWLLRSRQVQASQDACTKVVQTDATLSREQLAQLLTIPERDSKERVRQVVAEPYCELPTLQVRSGVEARREAYPLEFDPKTYLVLLYENDEYAGYRFNFE